VFWRLVKTAIFTELRLSPIGVWLVFLLAGASLYFWCAWDIVSKAFGTPVDPPNKLVIRGAYRYLRHPR
jgi:hypothetical protein